jgi:hypothetical protein
VFLGDITDADVLAQVTIFVPWHALGREIKEVIEHNLGRAVSQPELSERIIRRGQAPECP